MQARSVRGAVKSDAGFTLVELLAAIVVGLLVIFAAYSILDAVISSQAKVTAKVETVQRGRSVVDEMNRIIRAQSCLPTGGAALVSASSERLRVHAGIGPGRLGPDFQKIDDYELVFSPAGSHVTMHVYESTETPPPFGSNLLPTLSFPASPTRTRRIAEAVRRDGSEPFFRYYAYEGSPPTATRELTGGPWLTPGDLAQVARVEMRFVAYRGDTGLAGAPPQPTAKKTVFANTNWVRAADPDVPQQGAC